MLVTQAVLQFAPLLISIAQAVVNLRELPIFRGMNDSLLHVPAGNLSSSSSANDGPRPQYRRVTVGVWQDNAKLYQFLIDCIENPDYASSVQEIVLDRPEVGSKQHHDYGCFGHGRRQWYLDASEAAAVAARKSPFEDLVRQLDAPNVDNWLTSLAWMTPSIIEERDRRSADERGDRSHEEWSTISREDYRFMLHAGVLLLALCPNVESLIYMGYRSNLNYGNIDPSVTDDFLRRNNWGMLSGRYLQKLQRVVIYPEEAIDCRPYVRTDPIQAATRFHRLPSIRTLAFHGMTEDYHAGYTNCWPPGTAEFSALRLTTCGCDSQIGFALIRMSKRLESLCMHMGGRYHRDMSSTDFELNILYKALASHRDSLVDLDITGLDRDFAASSDYTAVDPGWEAGQPRRLVGEEAYAIEQELHARDSKMSKRPDELFPFQVQLETRYRKTLLDWPKQFVALKRLAIPAAMLLGQPATIPFRLIDALPDSLEYLHVRNYTRGVNDEWDGQIDELIREKAQKLPRLATVVTSDEAPIEPDYQEGEEAEVALLGDLGHRWIEA